MPDEDQNPEQADGELGEPQDREERDGRLRAGGVNVSSGIPSAELATSRPFKMEFTLMLTFISRTGRRARARPCARDSRCRPAGAEAG